MKLATILVSLSSELFYTLLMFVTWVVLLGWAAALIGACTLAFRNRLDEEENTDHEGMPLPVSDRRDHSPTPLGFGL
jgi:hypothetical protein